MLKRQEKDQLWEDIWRQKGWVDDKMECLGGGHKVCGTKELWWWDSWCYILEAHNFRIWINAILALNRLFRSFQCFYFSSCLSPFYLSFPQMGWKRSEGSYKPSSAMKTLNSGWPARTTRNSNPPSSPPGRGRSTTTTSRYRPHERQVGYTHLSYSNLCKSFCLSHLRHVASVI